MDEHLATVDFDLGELSREPAKSPEPDHPPLRQRLAALRTLSWQVLTVVAAVVLAAAAVGWQVGGARARDAANARLSNKPPVLAWIVDDGPASNSSVHTPVGSLELHIANLGSTAIRLDSAVSQTDRGSVEVDLVQRRPLTIPAGQTSTTLMSVRPDCGGAYVSAAVQVFLSSTDGAQPDERIVIDDSGDATLGNSYVLALNQICARPTVQLSEGGINGIFVVETSSAAGAALVLTNGTSGARRVDFAALEADGFELREAPSAPFVIGPGQSRSVFLTVQVDGCDGVGRLTNWAQGLSMQITAPDQPSEGSPTATPPAVTPAQYELREAILAPLGAAVEKACG